MSDERGYTDGPVIEVGYIRVEYGHFETYIDWLNSTWRPTMEAMKKAVRLGITLRCAPSAIKGIVPAMRCIGSTRPVRHAGSMDLFLEAITTASANDVLVVDNDGRRDEACVGDLIALEAKQAGLRFERRRA